MLWFLTKTFLPMWPPPRTLALLLWIWDFISLIRSWRKERTAFSQIFHQARIRNIVSSDDVRIFWEVLDLFVLGVQKCQKIHPSQKMSKNPAMSIYQNIRNVWKFSRCQYTKMSEKNTEFLISEKIIEISAKIFWHFCPKTVWHFHIIDF